MHRIRLRGPWQITALDPQSGEILAAAHTEVPGEWGGALGDAYRGLACYSRRFGLPTNLSSSERVSLVIVAVDRQAIIELNGQLLGQQDLSFGEWKYDITQFLQPRNELRIMLTSSADRPGRLGEVRLEIEDAGPP